MGQKTDFREILRVLAGKRVEFVVVGGVAAVLQGVPVSTFDLDIVHSRSEENVSRLLQALAGLEAVFRAQPSRRMRPRASRLATGGHQLLLTRYGPLGVLGEIGQGLGYESLLPDTDRLDVGDGVVVPVVRLARLIALKEEIAGEKDRAQLPVLRQSLRGLACVYCGGTSDLTRDHVPPKSWFAKPYPPDLPTVQSCRRCSEGFQVDDEYFRLTLATRWGAAPTKSGVDAQLRALRGLKRPEAERFFLAFLQSFRSTGAGPAIHANAARLRKTAARILKGLYALERGYGLDPSHEAVVVWLEEVPEEVAAEDSMLRGLASAEDVSIGDVLTYRRRFDPVEPGLSAWLLVFWGATVFAGITGPRAILPGP